MKPVIDAEFSKAIPPLSAEEYALLEESVIREGCRDALVVWAGHDILLDGHNRLRICEAHGIPYVTTPIELADREAAADWIDANQLGRRNLTPDQASLLRGRRYNRVKGGQGGDHKSKYQNDTLIDQAARLATQHGVSAPTIKRDGRFAEAVETLEKFFPDIEERVMTGDVASRQAVIGEAKKVEQSNVYQPVAATIFSHRSEEYDTPAHVLGLARAVLGVIDLDPASNHEAQKGVRAARYFTKDDDGLLYPWKGRVWLNPPYGKTAGKSNQELWSQRLVDEYQNGEVTEALLLVKAALGYKWFEELFRLWPVCFMRDRLSFILDSGEDDGQSKQGTAIFYFGENFMRFAQTFRPMGRIIPPEAELDATLYG